MCQQHFFAAVASQAEFMHDLSLLSFRNRRTIKVGTLSIGVTLEFLEATLVEQPLIGEALSAVHTTHRDDHSTYLIVVFSGVSILGGGRGHLSSAVSPTPSEMSSTLFNRGMTSQVGMRRRAEEVKKSIDELRSTVTDTRSMQVTIDEITRENITMRAMITAMEGRMSILETNAATQTITVAGLHAKVAATAVLQVDTALTSRVDTIESHLSTVATTTAQLQDRMGGVESSVSGVSERVSSLESRPVPSA
jgi:hypothetical protein